MNVVVGLGNNRRGGVISFRMIEYHNDTNSCCLLTVTSLFMPPLTSRYVMVLSYVNWY